MLGSLLKRTFGLVVLALLVGTPLLPAGSAEPTADSSRALPKAVTFLATWRLSITGSATWNAPMLSASSESITIVTNGMSEAGPGL